MFDTVQRTPTTVAFRAMFEIEKDDKLLEVDLALKLGYQGYHSTVRRCVRQLRDLGLIDRSQGQKSPLCLTTKGRNLIKAEA